MRPKIRTWVWIGLLLGASCMPGINPAVAVEPPSGAKELLQKGLTVFEIDQELKRIESQESTLKTQLAAAETLLQGAETASKQARQHAASVVRAYYMGDRDSLWTLLFSSKSFSDGLAVLDYLQMIWQNDKLLLNRHQEAWRKQVSIKDEIIKANRELQQTKQRFVDQRAMLVKLQAELDKLLAQEAQAASLQVQITELNKQWHEEGLPLFKTYFRELAIAMQDLPQSLKEGPVSGGTGTAGGGSKYLSLFDNGLNSTFKMTDTQLNEYIKGRSPMLTHLHFRFETDQVIVSGRHENIDFSMKGTYSLTKDDHTKPYIRFHVQELQFNGYFLPTTTIEELEKEVNLNIYPEKLAPMLQVIEVKLEPGLLRVIMKLVL